MSQLESKTCKVSERFKGKFTPEGYRAIVLEALGEALAMWRTEFAPRHFEESAYGRYHYAHRTKKYTESKVRRFHHRHPLELTGRSKQEILHGPQKVKITKKGRAQLFTYPPVYFWKSQTTRGRIADELKKATRDELTQLAKMIRDKLVAKLASTEPVKDAAT